jgi:hypothetical protein
MVPWYKAPSLGVIRASFLVLEQENIDIFLIFLQSLFGGSYVQ